MSTSQQNTQLPGEGVTALPFLTMMAILIILEMTIMTNVRNNEARQHR
jgi:hypothetical protein